MSATGIFLTCRAGHIEHRPLLWKPPAAESCEQTVRENRSVKVCREFWIAWKAVGSQWIRIPGPWWGSTQEFMKEN